jgi:NitT/TauT family transport system ATP-binding protein
MIRVRAGFIPLTDAAVLIAAADKGFAAEEGIALDLVREASWANIRDRLLYGDIEAAHLLAPLAISATLGIGQAPVALTVPATLGLNGSSIIIAGSLQAALEREAQGDLADPKISGAALARLVARRRQAGEEPLSFAMVFPFSAHNYLLRVWLAAAGLDPDEDVRLVVVPPPYMVESLSRGHVQGFCVGAPWPSVAVAAGLGHILHFSTDIIAACPDKVLAVQSLWSERNPEGASGLTRATIRAAAWCALPDNREELAQILAAPGRLGVSAGIIRHALDGRLVIAPDGRTRHDPFYFRLSPEPAIRPIPAHAAWLYAQMVRWRQTGYSAETAAIATAVYDPGAYDAALAALGLPNPVLDQIGAFAGPTFDPADVPGYLRAVG